MYLAFAPIRHDQPLTVSCEGDVLILNGTAFDFGPLPEGALLPQDAIDSPWFAGPVQRIGGVLQMTLLLPHGAGAPRETLFPTPIRVLQDGPVTLPPFCDPAPLIRTASKEPAQDAY